MNIEKYRYVAHRGLHDSQKGILENTIEAFRKAMDLGYAIELDVQLTKDNKLVVFHDYNLFRMTGYNLYVHDVTLEDLCKIKLKDGKSYIPTLEEVLNLVNGKVPLLIEIKNEGKVGKLESILADALSKYGGEFMLEAFNPFVVRYFKKSTNYLCGLLASKKYTSFKGKLLGLFTNFLISSNILNADFIAYKFKDLDEKVLAKIKREKLPLLLWTIDNDLDSKKALEIGDGIIFENIIPDRIKV